MTLESSGLSLLLQLQVCLQTQKQRKMMMVMMIMEKKKKIHAGSLSAAAIQRVQYATGVDSGCAGGVEREEMAIREDGR